MTHRYKHKDPDLSTVHFESEKPIEEWGFGTEVIIKRDDYPHWICRDCAASLGYVNRFLCSTFHNGICGWCDQEKVVTEPRDYNFPIYSKIK